MLTVGGCWEEKRPKVKRPIDSGASYFDELYARRCHSETDLKHPVSAVNAGLVKHASNMGRSGVERCVLGKNS